MEKTLKQILAKLNGMESDIKGLKSDIHDIKPKVNDLYERKVKIDESHEWLEALHHNSQVHKAEVDQINHKIVTIEGALSGVANSLEPLKRAL